MKLGAVSDLLANLRAGARLACFLTVERSAFRIGPAQLVLLAVVSALLDNGADWIRAQPGAVLDWAALGAEFASLAVLVVVAALLAWLVREPDLSLALPIVVLASFPLVQVANLGPWLVAQREIQPPWLADTAYYLVLLWFLAVLVRSAYVAMTARRGRVARAVIAGALLASPLAIPEGVLPEQSWWSGMTAPAYDDATNPASEAVIAFQRQLQDEALDNLEAHAQGSADLYFIAFAADGNDAGAATRVDDAIETMNTQWRTEGRSLAYVNDYATLTETPMATVSHLREALTGIATVSDPDEDIVMIYLSGRTNADGTLRVALSPLGLMQLSGASLGYLFNQAELKWRVIVVDACDARAFADALADEDSVVLAAGSCGKQADATTFGKTVFAAFSGAKSISGALQVARRDLAARGMEPRVHIGSRIESRLERVRATEAGSAAWRAPGIGGLGRYFG